MTARDLLPDGPPPAPWLGTANAGLVWRPARATAGAVSPFRLLHEDALARTFLLEVRSADAPGDEAVLARHAWRLRRDDPLAAGTPGAAGNAARDAAWARDLDMRARAGSPHVLAPVAGPPSLLRSLPLWWCRRTDRWFHPVAPATGLPLSVCRDDERLRRAGLPPYAEDVVRHLHDGSPDSLLYRPGEAPPGQTAVQSGAQLVRGWSRLVHGDPAQAAVARAAAVLPCLSCPHRAECHPVAEPAGAIPAEQELVPVSFHDVEAVLLPPFDGDYEQAVARLGGDGTARPDGWLFGADAQRWPLEVLWRKVLLFEQVVAGAEALHALGRPLLALAPADLAVRWAEGSPACWQAQVALLGLGAAVPLAADLAVGADADAETWSEPSAAVRADARRRTFLPPELRSRDGLDVAMTVACSRIGGDGGTALAVEAEGAVLPRGLGSGDAVLVQPDDGGRPLLARLEEVRARGISASAVLPGGDPCLALAGRTFAARLSFHARVAPGADGHTLGLLLLRTLVVDDESAGDDVDAAVARCLRRLEDEPTAVRQREPAAAERWLQLLLAREQRGRFEPQHLLHRREDRQALAAALAGGPAPALGSVWRRLLVVAGRLLYGAGPFAYADGLGDAAVAGFARLRADLAVVRQRLHLALFAPAARDAEIAAACDAVLAELPAEGAPARPAAPGCRLLLRREHGAERGEELRFDAGSIPIGRREGENLLRLNDPMVSSLHAVLQAAPGGWEVVDRGSTNGTEVDGIRLPADVPMPLPPGSTIRIQPFVLTLLPAAEAGADGAAAAPPLTPSVAELRDLLEDAHARGHDRPAAERREALRRELIAAAAAGGSAGAAPFARVVRELVHELRPAGSGDSRAEVRDAAVRALAQLARTLLGPAEPPTAAAVQAFAGKLARFVETTTEWIERMLELRRTLGRHLELGATTTGGGRAPLRSAADVRRLLLDWAGDAPAAEPSAWFLARFYDDLLAILAGLLRGNQQIRRAVRERLDPERLVEAAGREARVGLLVQAAASSALWKAYVQAFQEVTGDGRQEDELEQVLQRALQPRTERT